nr:hypothetical protein [Nostoc sp. DedVER01b]MDZ8115539.1 hypothetical protein [Nostoc sp. DedVER01b]
MSCPHPSRLDPALGKRLMTGDWRALVGKVSVAFLHGQGDGVKM